MAWVLFWALLALFTGTLAVFLYLILAEKGSTAQQISVGLLDGIVGWTMKNLVKYLFPIDNNS